MSYIPGMTDDILNSTTHGVHPIDEGRNTGEDGGLPGVVTSQTRHKAGNAVHGVLSTKFAVQRATGVTLK